MGLELKQIFTQKADGTEVYIEVENATGLYDAGDNAGGFGAPNEARNEVALIFYGLHKKNEDDDVEAVPNANDPLTLTKFTIPMDDDQNGHLEAYVWALEIYDSGGAYVDDDIVYDNENPAAPFIKKMVASEWVEIDPVDLIGEDGVIDELAINEFPVPQAQEFVNELNAAKLLKLRAYIKDECGREDYEGLLDQYNYAEGLLRTATDAFAALAYNEAEINIEAIFDYKEELANG